MGTVARDASLIQAFLGLVRSWGVAVAFVDVELREVMHQVGTDDLEVATVDRLDCTFYLAG